MYQKIEEMADGKTDSLFQTRTPRTMMFKEISFQHPADRETTVPTSSDDVGDEPRRSLRSDFESLDGPYRHRCFSAMLTYVGLASYLEKWEALNWSEIARKSFLIYPHKSPWLMPWEVFLMGLLIVTAFYEPVALALSQRTTVADTIFNGVLDVSFTTDMVLTFLVSFKYSEESSSTEVWEKDFGTIAKRYTAFPLSNNGRAGWFWLDLVSVFPGMLELGLHWVNPHSLSRSTNDHVNETTHLVRVFRFLRLIRMLRMVRLAAVVEKWHARYGWPFYITDVGKFVVITMLACHWVACAWIIAEGKVTRGYISYNSHDQESWLSALIKNKGDCCSPDATQDPLCVYILSSYWAMMTLTGVGFGDITPQNQFEIKLSSVVILVTGFIWSYIVGSVVGLLSATDTHGKPYADTMHEANDLMSNRDFPVHFQQQLRMYIYHAKKVSRMRSQQRLLKESLSEGAQQQIAEHSHLTRILKEKVFWVSGLEHDAVLTIAAALQPFLYAPQESVNVRERMVIVQDGMMQVLRRLIGRGQVYGEDTILLETEELSLRPTPISLHYLDVFALVRADVLDVCQHFPAAKKRLRRAQIRTAVYRKFILVAQRIQRGRRPTNKNVFTKLERQGPTFSNLDNIDHKMTSLPDVLAEQDRMVVELANSMRMRVLNQQQMLVEIVSANVQDAITELRDELAEIEVEE